MLVRIDNQQVWAGEPLDGLRHPATIEQFWTKDELNAVGLAPVQYFAVPEGQVCAGEPWYEIVDGVAVEHYKVVPTPPPATISDRQFFQALAMARVVTEAEALAAVKTGDIPAPLQAAIEQLPAGEQFGAIMLLSGATSFERSHPMTIMMGQLLGWTEEAVDNLFRQAAAL